VCIVKWWYKTHYSRSFSHFACKFSSFGVLILRKALFLVGLVCKSHLRKTNLSKHFSQFAAHTQGQHKNTKTNTNLMYVATRVIFTFFFLGIMTHRMYDTTHSYACHGWFICLTWRTDSFVSFPAGFERLKRRVVLVFSELILFTESHFGFGGGGGGRGAVKHEMLVE